MATTALAALQTTRRRRATRQALVTGAPAVVVVGLFVVTMMVGSFALSAVEVLGSVLGLREDPSVDFVVQGLRLPTATTALAVGLALGASGTIFQQLLRNPLASPDFVGITSGAGLAAVAAIVLLQVSGLVVAGFALGGALLAALPDVRAGLIAGPVANRLLGPAGGSIVAAALVGAALLLAADLVAVHVLPTPLPTGVVTGAVGAPYLLWLLATTNRREAGG